MSVVEIYLFGNEWNDLPEQIRHHWCDWARHHGIDPNDVMVPGFVERRPVERQIVYRSAADEQVRVVQLEAEPSPFPFLIDIFAEEAGRS